MSISASSIGPSKKGACGRIVRSVDRAGFDDLVRLFDIPLANRDYSILLAIENPGRTQQSLSFHMPPESLTKSLRLLKGTLNLLHLNCHRRHQMLEPKKLWPQI